MSSKLILINDRSHFSPQHMKFESNFYGIKKDAIELNIWIYEMLCQIQSHSQNNFVLKGGGASQLHIPLDFQRCTVDIDLLCSASEDDIINILSLIQRNFSKLGFPLTFEKYTPKLPIDRFHVIPMVTYLIYLPFRYYRHKNGNLKIDFIFGDAKKLETSVIHNPSLLGINLNYSPLCVSRETLISEKLLTFATNSVGLQEFKIDGLYKNIYDLYHLINTDTSLDSFKKVSQRLSDSIEFECSIKSINSLTKAEVLEDILMKLFNLFTQDLKTGDFSIHRKVKRFMEYSLQRNIRQSLTHDMWAILSMNIYVYVYSLISYMDNKSFKSLDVVNSYIEEAAFFETLSRIQKKGYIEELHHKIQTWDSDIIMGGDINIYRLIFLGLLIEESLI